MSKGDPRARDRIIGAKLRAIRSERAEISLERAAEMAGWSPSRLSRTERGLRNVTTDEVATLLTAWRIPTGEREEILAEVQSGSSSGWWDRPLPGVPAEVGALASYENDANELTSVAPNAIPGFLHTYETALGVMRAAGLSDMDIEINWMARLRRQQILGKVDYTAFIGQTALQVPYGGSGALRGQMEHLLEAQDKAMVIRIVPPLQTRVLILHAWQMMKFPNTSPVVHVELSAGSFYIHDKDVDPYTAELERLDQVALSQGDSRKLIGDLMKGL